MHEKATQKKKKATEPETVIRIDRRLVPRPVQNGLRQSIHFRASITPKIPSGMKDFDDVLGGGFSMGRSTLLGGEHGCGKTTLALQTAGCAARQGHKVVYNTAEMNGDFLTEYLIRTNMRHRNLYLTETQDFRHLLDLIYAEAQAPRFVFVDSIQSIYDPKCPGAPSGKRQLDAIIRLIKAVPDEVAFIFLGQATKAGKFAGTQSLPHAVDQVLWLGRDPLDDSQRPLTWAGKNRCGSTAIERILMMGPQGFWNYGQGDPRNTEAVVEEETATPEEEATDGNQPD